MYKGNSIHIVWFKKKGFASLMIPNEAPRKYGQRERESERERERKMNSMDWETESEREREMNSIRLKAQSNLRNAIFFVYFLQIMHKHRA